MLGLACLCSSFTHDLARTKVSYTTGSTHTLRYKQLSVMAKQGLLYTTSQPQYLTKARGKYSTHTLRSTYFEGLNVRDFR